MKEKRKALLIAAAVSSIFPFLQGLLTRRTGNNFGLYELVIFNIAIYWWYKIDKAQRGYSTGKLLNIGVALFNYVAIPIYFLRSRGAKNGAIAIAKAFGLGIGYGCLHGGSEYVGSQIAF
jgi:hypothetical protein